MILRLLRSQKAVRSIRALPIGTASGLLLVALQGTPPPALPIFKPGFTPQYFFYPALFFLMFTIPYMLSLDLTGRCSRMELTLPVPSRAGWLSHVAAVLMAGLEILVFATLALVVGNLIQGRPAMQANMISLIPNVAASLFLFVALAQLPRRDLYRVPYTAGYVAYLTVIGFGTLVLVCVLSAYSPVFAILPLAGAAGAFIRVYRTLPPALAMVPAEPEPGSFPHSGAKRLRSMSDAGPDTDSPSIVSDRTERPRWTVHGTVLRTLYNPWLTLVIFVILIILGSRNAGFRWSGISNLLWSFWVLVVLSGLFVTAVARIHMLDPLPVSRRLIFAYLILPSLAVAFSGFALGTVTGKGMAGERPLVEYSDRRFDLRMDVRVPLEYWAVSRDGTPEPPEPPEACCDEPEAGWSVRLFKGADYVLYNPYHAPADSSPAFVAGRLSRAIETVYGRHIPAEELVDRYFEIRPDGGTELKVGRMDLAADYTGLRPRGWSTSLAVVIALIGMIWLGYLTCVMPRAQSGITIGHLAVTAIGALYLAFIIWSENAGVTKPWKLSAVLAIAVRSLETKLPGGTFTLWAVAAAGLACCYLLAESRFVRMEAPLSRSAR